MEVAIVLDASLRKITLLIVKLVLCQWIVEHHFYRFANNM
jgi:hypothetical protein